MTKTKIAFDVDDTLIRQNDKGENVPKYGTVFLLQMMYVGLENIDIIVWSGSGVDYAKRWAEKLDIADVVRVIAKGSEEVDIAFDDQEVTLGTVNLKVAS